MSVFDFGEEEAPLEQQVAMGYRARALLDDEVVEQAFERAERNILQAWKNAVDRDHRESCWAMIHVVGEVRKQIRIIADDGEIARKRLEALSGAQ